MNDSERTGAYQPESSESPAAIATQPQYIGRFRVEKIVGHGGFGLVYLAHDEQLQRLVAIKVPHQHQVSTEDADAYLTEARNIANLDHPHIVPIFDVGGTDGCPFFIVTKFIEGSTLAKKIKDDRPTFGVTTELVATIAEALHYAHCKGLVHRDIKPGNILLDTSGKPFVVDFGLALREQDVGKGEGYAGTPAYMSPEQARGEGHRVDGRSDIFSLGVVFYEMLTGRRPFKADLQADLLEQITNVEVRPPRQVNDQIPKELERICLKALSKRASERYTTAKDMADDLRHFLNSPQREATLKVRLPSALLATTGNLSPQIGSSDQRAKVVRSTFFFADFKGFTERVRILEKAAGHQAAAEMKRRVAQYIEEAFRQLESAIKPDDYELIDTAGDGFFFHFRRAKDAFRIAEALHQITTAHNANVTDEIAEHWFRTGAATGDVAWDEGKPVGHVVNVGSRLQSASVGGDFVIDQATYDDLPPESQQRFGPKENIRDKHDKSYDVYRTAFGRPLSPLPSTKLNDVQTPVFRSAPTSDSKPIKIVPKGLRSFDAHDADFFLELLPGPRDRDGLPDSLRFWKTRIEEMDADNTFSVGLIYGPSGCGKSSLVKAGLIPRLSDNLIAVHVEATAEETETRLLNGLRKRCSGLPDNLSLKETLAALRRGQGIPVGKKVVIVLDQFEQWLHAKKEEQNTELVQALRQCDGGRVQCIVMVRDDFWMAATRFMRELEVRLVEAQNSTAVDLFDMDHAKKVLTAFGRAFGKLSENPTEKTTDQREFLKQAVSGLAQEGKVISVRLALFAEMMKGKTWTPTTLKEVGGTEGVGVTFLEETFSAATAPPEHRYHQKAARGVLKTLLPESGTDIKGHMRSYAELLEASGYVNRPKDFDDLVGILDSEIRLITPTDPEGKEEADESVPQAQTGQKYYQLTHDYLVPSLRDWLTRKQRETRKGRAELLLADRSVVWNARPENRQLPSLWQWLSIQWLTLKTNWTPPQQRMMRRAGRVHGNRSGIVAASLLVFGLVGVSIQNAFVAEKARIRAENLEKQNTNYAHAIVESLRTANTADIASTIKEIANYRKWATPLLQQIVADQNSNPKEKLHSSLALVKDDPSQVDYLYERLLKAEPQEVVVIRDALFNHKADLTKRLWTTLENSRNDQEQRLRAASALSVFAPADPRWEKVSGDVAATLVVQKPFVIAPWAEALKGVGRWLIPSFAEFLEDENRSVSERGLIASIYGKFAADTPVAFSRLEKRLTEMSGPDAKEETKVTLAKKQASIGQALLVMGQGEKAWPLLKHSPDPTVRSYLIERLGPGGVDSKDLMLRFEEEQEVSVKRAILLSLGQYGPDRLSLVERRNHLPWLLKLYWDDPDPGIHGAVEWLLRQWKSSDEWNEINKSLGTGSGEGKRQWYINRQGQTMVVVSSPGEFWMGEGDKRHRRRIDRSFALASKKVTLGEFLRFRKEYEYTENCSPTNDCPVNSVSWYEAAEYCNWLNEQDKLQKEQWCYLPNKYGKYAEGMTLAPDYLKRTGYRLPTEGEWEYACRAGADSGYSFGASVDLLGKYGWFDGNGLGTTHPVGLLKPNDLGLYDMHGNLWEWCEDKYHKHDDAKTYINIIRDSVLGADVHDEDSRVMRGGSFNLRPSFVRSAYRFSNPPTNRNTYNGFRLARTLPPVPFTASPTSAEGSENKK